MKRLRKFGFPLAILAFGIASGHWVSSAYGSAEPDGVVNAPLKDGARESSWQTVRRASRGVSSLKMPYFDFRKGS